jgi:hypothetical protein
MHGANKARSVKHRLCNTQYVYALSHLLRSQVKRRAAGTSIREAPIDSRSNNFHTSEFIIIERAACSAIAMTKAQSLRPALRLEPFSMSTLDANTFTEHKGIGVSMLRTPTYVTLGESAFVMSSST